MTSLKGKLTYLRALEPEDLDFIYAVENDEAIWHLSHTQKPYSRFLIKQYLDNAHQDIYEAKQLRLVICSAKNETLGLIDIFDFDFKNKRAGVGILIVSEKNRGKGYAREALQLLTNYCFTTLSLHQVYCNISENNTKSLNLFKAIGFEVVGLKKDWNFNANVFSNEYVLQMINN